MSPFVSIITPEPICPPCTVVTLISTTAGSIFAMAASCCASNVVLLDDVAVAVATALDVVLVLLLLFVNSRPANRPTPKMRTSTKVRSRIAPAPPVRLRGGGDEVCGPGGDLGGWDASCSGGVCVTGGESKIPTGADCAG